MLKDTGRGVLGRGGLMLRIPGERGVNVPGVNVRQKEGDMKGTIIDEMTYHSSRRQGRHHRRRQGGKAALRPRRTWR